LTKKNARRFVIACPVIILVVKRYLDRKLTSICLGLERLIKGDNNANDNSKNYWSDANHVIDSPDGGRL
jgi:hypothetical protein